MTKFAAFSLLLIVLVISSIYKVNSAPRRPAAQGGFRTGGFRALGVNYTTICHISIILRVYFARDYIFSTVPTKYFAHIPAYFFKFDVFIFEL